MDEINRPKSVNDIRLKTNMHSVPANVSSLSRFSAPIVSSTIGPTIVPIMLAIGKRPENGVPGVTAWDNSHVGSVKIWRRSSVDWERCFKGLANVDKITQATAAKAVFMILDESGCMTPNKNTGNWKSGLKGIQFVRDFNKPIHTIFALCAMQFIYVQAGGLTWHYIDDASQGSESAFNN